MGEDTKYYQVEDYLRWKRSQGKNNKVAPRPNILAAANWLRKFFDARKTNWAALGSLAMLCLGTRREIPDIHVVYDDKDFQRIRMKLQTDPRVRLPKDMNSMFSTKLLVSTGPKYNDVGCTEGADIEIEMIPPGSHGTPPSDILRNNQAMLSLNLAGKITNIKGLNITYLVNTTVHLCTSQDLLWDPKADLLWLCRKYGKEIQAIRGQLNARQVKENFLGTPFFSKLPAEEQRLCYHVLLGKDPPPSMFLTPAPSHGQSTQPAERPPITSHKSAPELKEKMKQQSDFLRPPMPGKAKTTPGKAPGGVAAKATTTIAGSSGTGHADQNSRDSRSRYRNASAPTTPSASRNVSPNASPASPAKNNGESRTGNTHQHSVIHQAQSVKMQHLAPSVKPQVVRTKKSLPRMDGQTISAQGVPVFAHNKPPGSQANAQTHLAPGSKSSGPDRRPNGEVSKASSHNSTSPSASRAQPQVVAHPHPAHSIDAQRTLKANKDQLEPAAVLVPHLEDHKPESPSKGLSVVGPEGLYPAPPKPTIPRKAVQPAAPTMPNQTQNNANGFVFELDAASPQVQTFAQAASRTEFVAELAADNNALPQPALQRFETLPVSPVSPPQVSAQFASTSSFSSSPVSPPTTFTPLASRTQPIAPMPVNEGRKDEPAPRGPMLAPSPPTSDALPASLMIGFRGSRRPSSPSQSSSGSSPSATTKEYQRYYSPPNSREASPRTTSTSAPNSRHPSPNRGPVYKAYTPPLTPPMQPKLEPAQHQQPTSTWQAQHLTPPALPSALSPPNRGAPIPMERAAEFAAHASPPALLRAGANHPQSINISNGSSFPNPLTANPPTPRNNNTHTKHDSHHQDHQISSKKPNFSTTQAHHTSAPQSQSQTRYPQVQAYAPPPLQSNSSQYIAFNPQQQPSSPPAPEQPRRRSSLHQRNVSVESNTSTTSHDSEKLAQEYQLDLPAFEDGFGTQGQKGGQNQLVPPPASSQKGGSADADAEMKRSYRPSYAGTGWGVVSSGQSQAQSKSQQAQAQAQYKLGTPDFGKAQGGFMDGFHFSR